MHVSHAISIYCSGCGYVAPATARFCVKCGALLLCTPPASPPPAPHMNRGTPTLSLDGGRYANVRPLSDRGGMGLIFLARDTRGGGRECIIKQLRPDPNLDQSMFEREAALLARLHHDRIPACWDHFTEHGSHYLVSEFIKGVALQDLIEQSGPASETDVICWGIDLCEALVYTHSNHPPIIHRDIKPDNVIITPQGQAVLVDFGIARTYQSGKHDTMKMGTWGYLPPEQKTGRTEPASDLYALGATLYFALTASDPQLLTIFDIHLHWQQGISFPPARQSTSQVSAEMEAILANATRVLAKDRYPSARAMLDELRTLQTIQQSTLCPHCQATHCRGCRTPPLPLPAQKPAVVPQRQPQNWSSFRGNATRAGFTTDHLRAPLQAGWSFQTQGPIDGSPIIHNGIVYVSSRDEWLYALEVHQQRELWRYHANAALRSTPTLHGDTLFFGDDHGTMHAVQSIGGAARWRVPLRGKIFASSAAGAGLIISATQGGHVVALTPTSGETIWDHVDSSPFYASPAILSNLVIVANGTGQVKGLDITSGKLEWTFQVPGQVRATPACYDGLTLVATLDGSVTLLNILAGERLWQRSLGIPISASPILTRDYIFAAGQDGALFALSRQDGTPIWATRVPGQLAASPILSGTTLLVINTDGTVLLLDAHSGTIGFQHALGAPVFASPAVYGPWCVIGTRQGSLCLLEGKL